MSGKSNRGNDGNQHSGQQHDHIRGTLDKGAIFIRPEPRPNQTNSEHEYYSDFDHTGRGINPLKPIKRHSH